MVLELRAWLAISNVFLFEKTKAMVICTAHSVLVLQNTAYLVRDNSKTNQRCEEAEQRQFLTFLDNKWISEGRNESKELLTAAIRGPRGLVTENFF